MFKHHYLTLFTLFTVMIFTANCVETPPPLEHEVQVIAAESEAPVAGASVRAEIGVRTAYEAITGPDGLAQLTIDARHREGWAKVIVEAEDYQRRSVLVDLAQEPPRSTVTLEPDSAETSAEPDEPTTTNVSDEPAAGLENNETDNNETDNNAAPAPLSDVPPAERADFYEARPELTIDLDENYRAAIKTSKGDIVVSLNAAEAPQHVNNFIYLSRQGFYDGLTFHRVEPGFVIQGGDPLGTGNGGPGYTIPGEFNLNHIKGALAMARLPDNVNPNRESSGSQFYITLAPTEFLDGQYSVFGQVEEGMDVVQSIEIGDVIEQVIVESN